MNQNTIKAKLMFHHENIVIKYTLGQQTCLVQIKYYCSFVWSNSRYVIIQQKENDGGF